MPGVVARDLTKIYSSARGRRVALEGVSFQANDGETLAILGPSGAGKSTILRILAGLERPERGAVFIGERNVTRLAPHRRRVGLVFQDDALFPHLSVEQNLAFGMRRNGARGDAREKIVRLADALGIAPHVHERPARLSGGERQRAAIARALLAQPDVLLLDEPLAHLDPQLRLQLRGQFARLRETLRGPAIYVTHDHLEALAVADRVAVLIDGAIVQCDEPERVYEYPGDVRVARFVGAPAMNILEMDGTLVGVRPEYVRVDESGAIRGRVLSWNRAGADRYVRAQTAYGEVLARVPQNWHANPHGEIGMTFPPERVRRFDRTTGKSIDG